MTLRIISSILLITCGYAMLKNPRNARKMNNACVRQKSKQRTKVSNWSRMCDPPEGRAVRSHPDTPLSYATAFGRFSLKY